MEYYMQNKIGGKIPSKYTKDYLKKTKQTIKKY